MRFRKHTPHHTPHTTPYWRCGRDSRRTNARQRARWRRRRARAVRCACATTLAPRCTPPRHLRSHCKMSHAISDFLLQRRCANLDDDADVAKRVDNRRDAKMQQNRKRTETRNVPRSEVDESDSAARRCHSDRSANRAGSPNSNLNHASFVQ